MDTPRHGLVNVFQVISGFAANVSDVVNVGDKVKVRDLLVSLIKESFFLTFQTSEDLASRSKQDNNEGSRVPTAALCDKKKRRGSYPPSIRTFLLTPKFYLSLILAASVSF